MLAPEHVLLLVLEIAFVVPVFLVLVLGAVFLLVTVSLHLIAFDVYNIFKGIFENDLRVKIYMVKWVVITT